MNNEKELKYCLDEAYIQTKLSFLPCSFIGGQRYLLHAPAIKEVAQEASV